MTLPTSPTGCTTCGGAGTIRLWRGFDPDAYLVERPCPACNAAGRERGPCPPGEHKWQAAIGSDNWVCATCGDGK